MKYFEQIEDVLTADFSFDDFAEALNFVNQCGELFEQHGHHGDIGIFDYSQVNIMLTTHSAGNTVTEKDTKLAEAVELLVQ